MAIEMNTDMVVCFKCGRRYSRRKGYFPVNYSILYKGVGYLPICKDCIDAMYNEYLAQCGNAKDAVRQMCRKLNLYWDENVYEIVTRKSTTRSMMTQYIAKTNSVSYAGKSYDDTLSNEGTLWNFGVTESPVVTSTDSMSGYTDADSDKDDDEVIKEYMQALSDFKVTKDIIAFWGAGYTKQMYAELEQRRAYWMDRFPKDVELDIGTEALIRQICSLELDINRDRADGKAVDKSVNALNTLLGSANLKPAQAKSNAPDDISKAPLGVKLYHREKFEPLPEVQESEKDRKHIKKYIWTWMGHLCKMCGIKNGYTKLYDEAIQRLRVEMLEYSDESDEDLITHYFEDESDTQSEQIGGDVDE